MLAIIPARGGSKGLPGKNIRPLHGKPLIAYSVEAALGAKHITEVIISTDDQEIADVAVKYGASLPFIRPAELATDTAMAVDNYIYTINRLNETRDKKIDSFVVLQPTSPLRTSADIDGAIELFQAKNADSVISYTEEHHPISWHKHINEDLTLSNIFETNINNRQENKPTYFPNGCLYVFKFSLIEKRQYFTDKSYAYIMPRSRSVDIDTLEDFEYAEFLMSR